MDESTLRAKNIPSPDLDSAYDLTQAIAKAEAAKQDQQEVPVFGDSTWIQKANHPRCRECGTSTSKPAYCFFCREPICAKCTRFETWGGQSVTICKSCRQAGKEVDAEIKHEEKVYCKCKFTDAHECAVAKRLPGYAGYGHVLCDCYCHSKVNSVHTK